MCKPIFFFLAVCWAANATPSTTSSNGIVGPTTAHANGCADYIADDVSDAVNAAVAPLHLTIRQQAQIIQTLIKSEPTTTTAQTPPTQNASTEFDLSRVIAAIASLEQKVQQQAEAIEDLINSEQNTTQHCPSDELLTNNVAQLPKTIQEVNLRLPRSCGYNKSDYYYYPKTNSCYKMHQVEVNWTQANATCSSTGAHLAVPNSAEEAQILDDIVRTRDGVWQENRYWAHIGVYRSSDQVWRTVTGETLEKSGYNTWFNTDNPSSDAEFSRVFIYKGKLQNEQAGGLWKNYFICEKKPQ